MDGFINRQNIDYNANNNEIGFVVIEQVKINIDDILSPENIENIKNFFIKIWFNNYYDFYYFSPQKFFEIILSNNDIKFFFKKVLWKENFDSKNFNRNQVLLFAERIWFNKLSYVDFKNEVIRYFNNIWVTNLNQYEQIWLNKLMLLIKSNNLFRYFSQIKLKKLYSDLIYDDFIKLWNIIWFEKLYEEKIIIELKQKLNQENVFYIEDLEKITVRWFKNFIWNNKWFNLYLFELLWKYKSYIKEDDIIFFWKRIWLNNKEIENKYEKITEFLNYNWIYNYYDFKELGINQSRNLLANNDLCMELLHELWLKLLKDFRKEYLERFCRRVWINWVPPLKENNNEIIKEKIKEILKENWINCDYSLKLYWINKFTWIFKESKIWKILYEELNSCIKYITWTTIPHLNSSDLGTISKSLWLEIITKEKHKEILVETLKQDWLDINSINTLNIKKKYWKNLQIKYFLWLQWITDIKQIRSVYVNKMKEYINSI